MDELGLIKVVYEWFRGRRMAEAMNEDGGAAACVACSSASVSSIGPGAYRCNDCGYEGGPGLAALAEQRKRDKLSALDPSSRRRRAYDRLVEARRLLSVGIADLDQASRESAYDAVGLNIGEGLGEGEGAAKYSHLTAGVGSLLQARDAAKEAEMCLGVTLGTPEVDTGSAAANHVLVEADLWFDNIVVDAVAHIQISDAIRQASQLQGVVDAALSVHFPQGEPGSPFRSS